MKKRECKLFYVIFYASSRNESYKLNWVWWDCLMGGFVFCANVIEEIPFLSAKLNYDFGFWVFSLLSLSLALEVRRMFRYILIYPNSLIDPNYWVPLVFLIKTVYFPAKSHNQTEHYWIFNGLLFLSQTLNCVLGCISSM